VDDPDLYCSVVSVQIQPEQSSLLEVKDQSSKVKGRNCMITSSWWRENSSVPFAFVCTALSPGPAERWSSHSRMAASRMRVDPAAAAAAVCEVNCCRQHCLLNAYAVAESSQGPSHQRCHNLDHPVITADTHDLKALSIPYCQYFGTSVNTQQWTQRVTAQVHGVSSRKYQLDVVE